VGYNDQAAQLPAMKEVFAWLSLLPSQSLQQTLLNLDQAFVNFLLNLRADGFRPRAKPSPWRHPRQRIFNSLSLLLWEPGAADEPVQRERIRNELNARGSSLSEWVAAYQALWMRIR
jgi:hypothetical protein